MSSTVSSTQSLQFACPDCNKRFSVRREKIITSEPEFECNRCHCTFSLQTSLESPFATTKKIRSAPKASICPKCGTMNNASHEECRVCGVVMAKYKGPSGEWGLTNGSTKMPHHIKNPLESLWRRVLNSYEDQSLHEEFLSTCMKNGELAFAMQKYQSLMDLIPGDELAAVMRERIRSLASVQTTPKPKSVWPWRMLVIFLPILAGLFLFFFGLKSYEFRNLAGLGAGITVLALGVLAYLS